MAASVYMPNYSLRCKAPFDLVDRETTYLLDIACSCDLPGTSTRGNIVAASASNHTIKLYCRDTLQFQKQLVGHEDRITALQFSSEEPSILWSASQDATIRIWDVRMDQASCQVNSVNSKHGVPFHSMAVNVGSTVMVAGTAVDSVEDVHVILWDLRTYQELARFSEAHSDDVTQVKFNTKNPHLFSTGSMDGLVCLFDTRQLSEEDSLRSVLNAEASVAKLGFFGPSEDFIFALTNSETFCLWDVHEGTQHSRLLNLRETMKITHQVQTDYFVDCSFDPSSGRLFILGGDNDGRLFVFNAGVNGCAPLAALSGGHAALIRCAHWDHMTGSLITGGEDGLLCHWQHSEGLGMQDTSVQETRKVSSVAETRLKRKITAMPY